MITSKETFTINRISKSYIVRFTWALALIFTTLINLLFRSQIPTNAGWYSPHDDLLGIRLTRSLLDGDWLGEWSNLTLAKPPGYSFLLGILHFLPFQTVVSVQALFCLAAGYLTFSLQKIFVAPRNFKVILSYLIYTFLIFNPYLFGLEFSRIYRSNLHAILLLLFLTFAMNIFHQIISLKPEVQNLRNESVSLWFKWFSISLTYSLLVLVRSESYWILGVFFLLLTFVILSQRRKFRVTLNRISIRYFSLFMAIIIGFLTYMSPISYVNKMNEKRYGISQIENYYSGEFANAMKLWASVDEGYDARPFIVISAKQRLAVYKISANALKLKPFLELPPGKGWQRFACGSPNHVCDNSGGWATWEIRDAAISTKLIKNEVEFQHFFGDLADDIKNACDLGTLSCRRTGIGVGAKNISDLPILKIGKYAILNILSALMLRQEKDGLVAVSDFNKDQVSSIREFHAVAKYDSNFSSGSDSPNIVSTKLAFLYHFYLPLQIILFLLAILGLVFRKSYKSKRIAGVVFLYGCISMFVSSIGVAIAQVSFGWRVEGPYLLTINVLIQFISGAGTFSFFEHHFRSKNLKSSMQEEILE
jgi:hypothetical protein